MARTWRSGAGHLDGRKLVTSVGTEAVSCGGRFVLVEEREDLPVPRCRGGDVVRERDRAEGQDVMASSIGRGEYEGNV